MKKSTKTLLWLLVLAAFDVVIPFPIVASVLVYVVLARPPWFRELVAEVYAS